MLHGDVKGFVDLGRVNKCIELGFWEFLIGGTVLYIFIYIHARNIQKTLIFLLYFLYTWKFVKNSK